MAFCRWFYSHYYWRVSTLRAALVLCSAVWTTVFLALNTRFVSFSFLIHLSVKTAFMFPPCRSRTKFGLPESEACFLQGAGQRRLRGLAVEKERCKGLLLSEVEEVLVCSEGQLPVLVHQWGGESLFLYLSSPFASMLSDSFIDTRRWKSISSGSFPKIVTYFIVFMKTGTWDKEAVM